MRKRENKNYRSVPFLPDAKQKFPKEQQKNSENLKNTIIASFQSKIGRKRPRKTENKNYRSVSFLPGAKQKIKKKQQKNQKIPLRVHFQPKQVGKGREKQKIKIIVTFLSYPTQNRKFQNNSKKIQKIKKYQYGFISIQNRLENAEKNRK